MGESGNENKRKERVRGRWMRGLCAILAFLCALCFGAEIIAGSGDYKTLVDGLLGGTGGTAGAMDDYAFQSEYENLAQLITERKRIAEQISEEGSVLLKNNALKDGTPSLPLLGEETVKATMLGSRAYTYRADGSLRDTSLTFYGGITGSKIYEQTATLSDGTTVRLPVTMERALTAENIELNPNMLNFYSGKPFPTILTGSEGSGNEAGPYAVNEPKLTLGDCGDDATRAAYSDVCFVVIGRCSGEGRDYLPGPTGVFEEDSQESALGLSDEERELVTVADGISENVVVIINSAIPMEIEELKEDDRVDSILWIGLPGSYGLGGVARLLRGKASPSGKLPDTYAVEAKNSPAAQNYGIYTQEDNTKRYVWSNMQATGHTATDDSHYVVLAEGLYTGYRYYETRYADTVLKQGNASSSKGASGGADEWKYENEVSYSFGYGLGYTTFKQEILPDSFTYDSASRTISLTVRVTNTGNFPAKDVVQLYVSQPYTAYDRAHGVEKAAIQLADFGKTQTLYPENSAGGGTSTEDVVLTADIKYFASYDETAAHDSVVGGYIMEKGEYLFAIGNGAHEALNNALLFFGAEREALVCEEGEEPSAEKVVAWDPSGDMSFSFDADGVDTSYLSRTATGQVVSNRMQDADYNFFKANTVVYLSRNDWDGTFPVSYPFLEETDGMRPYLNDSVYQFGTSGTSQVEFGVDHSEELDENGIPAENMSISEMKLAAYDDPRWDYLLTQVTFDEAWRLAPYGGSKCIAFTSVNAPEVWQIDGPNGNVTRRYKVNAPSSGYLPITGSDPNANYFSADMPCAPVVGAAFNKDLANEQGKIYGEDNIWSRNPIMWAPGMNLHRCPYNSRNHEYYSEDPILANRLGVAFVRGGVEKGSILAAKHFAFNTQESYREGLAQFMEEQSARELELRAFEGLCEDVNFVNAAGNTVNALGLMSSFSRTGVCNVNAHTGVMKEILRGEWGFKGLISTDMVIAGQYFNPQDGIVNYVTFMATSNAVNLLKSFWVDYNNKSKVKSDPVFMNALYENVHYYMYSIANSIALNGYSPGDVITQSMSWWENMLIALGSVFGAGAIGIIGVFCVSAARSRKRRKKDV